MGGGPVGSADVVQAEAEQARLQPQLGVLHCHARGIARPAEIADRFIVDGRHVYARQIAGPEQPRQVDRVAPVGLDLVAGLLRNQRRRHDLAREALAGQIAVEDVPAGAGLVREHQVRRLRLESPDQRVAVRLARPDGADKHRRINAESLRVCDRDRIVVDVQTDEQRSRLAHG